ncbi:MAG TPA: hypothetical protein VHB50_20325 [Bryobacteraceae bacterium]|nr:hypothetical protein [Bryobacteraceae bacterium]
MTVAGGDSSILRVTGTATGCVVTTLIGSAGVECDLKSSGDALAFLESTLRVTGPEQFVEDGAISFGDDNEHELQFSTPRPGHLLASPEAGSMSGTCRWEIAGGKGQFAGARGFIASNFTLDGGGDLDELHCGLIYIPEGKRETGFDSGQL